MPAFIDLLSFPVGSEEMEGCDEGWEEGTAEGAVLIVGVEEGDSEGTDEGAQLPPDLPHLALLPPFFPFPIFAFGDRVDLGALDALSWRFN